MNAVEVQALADALRGATAELDAFQDFWMRVGDIVHEALGREEIETAEALVEAMRDLQARAGEFVVREETS